jgi:hypothetical protein
MTRHVVSQNVMPGFRYTLHHANIIEEFPKGEKCEKIAAAARSAGARRDLRAIVWIKRDPLGDGQRDR